MQQFYLGYWSAQKQAKLKTDFKTIQENKTPLKTTKVEGVNLPYVQMEMDDGKRTFLNFTTLSNVHYYIYLELLNAVDSFDF